MRLLTPDEYVIIQQRAVELQAAWTKYCEISNEMIGLLEIPDDDTSAHNDVNALSTGELTLAQVLEEQGIEIPS